MSQYIQAQRDIQTIALQVAYETQSRTDQKHLSKDNTSSKTTFAIGDYVLVAYENDRPPTKLHPLLRGPCQIVNIVNRSEGDVYTVQHLDSVKCEDFHVKLLRPFNHDSRFTSPIAVATTDNQSFIVEAIQSHKFSSRKQNRSNMQVLVKWIGYELPTWEPYANVAKLQLFHDYLRKHNLARLLQPNFKEAGQQRKRTALEETASPNTTQTKQPDGKRQRRLLGRQ